MLFGLPGRGKTHFAAAVGYELVQRGREVLFSPTYQVVGQLLRAKRDLELERALRRLERFEVLILDDLGYVQQSREEMEVLFTLLASAGLDRLAHNAYVLVITGPSYRTRGRDQLEKEVTLATTQAIMK